MLLKKLKANVKNNKEKQDENIYFALKVLILFSAKRMAGF